MRYLTIITRILLGLVFLVFGLNGFLHFIPQPKDAMPPGAMDFFGALVKTNYMVPLIFATQTLGGALLLLNRFVPLALALRPIASFAQELGGLNLQPERPPPRRVGIEVVI